MAALTLPADWTETHVGDHADGMIRVYRKRAGDLVLTIDANTADRGADLAHEWADFVRRHREASGGG